MWAEKNGTNRHVVFEEPYSDNDRDGKGNIPRQPHWAFKLEVWGNCELGDGKMVHGLVADAPWDASKPDLEARVHGDGIPIDYVWISSANKPRGSFKGKYWCHVVPDTAAYRNLRNQNQHGLVWLKLLANIRAESRDPPPLSNQDRETSRCVIEHQCPNPSQALAVRRVLDESCITTLSGGAGTGKSETLVACIKAVLRRKGYIVAQDPDPADPSTVN